MAAQEHSRSDGLAGVAAEELFEASADGLLVVGPDGVVLAANSALRALTGHRVDDVVGQPVEVLLPPLVRDRHRGRRESYARSPQPRDMGSGLDLRIATSSGELVPVDISLSPLPGAGTGAVLAVVRDVRAHRAREDAWQHQALHDPLTGLANRALLLDRVASAAARSQRSGRAFGVFFLDLDDFKPVNDRHGHAAGDEVLRAAARRLVVTTRPSDTVARVGGDEFVVLLEDVGTHAAAALQAERLRAAVEGPVDLGDVRYDMRCSVGLAVADGHADVDALLSDADAGMYGDKAQRRQGPAVRTDAAR